jgi:uncharacterized lipoprotein
MRNAGILLCSLVLLTGATACKSPLVGCHQSNKDYAGAPEVPPLQAPPGLEAPNTRNALKVPPLNTPERVRGPNEPCLDTPPPYSASKPIAPPPAEPPKKK